MEADPAGGYFTADGSGVVYFCAGNYIGGVIKLLRGGRSGAGGKLGKYAAGQQAYLLESAVDDDLSRRGGNPLRAEPESSRRRP